ncbi:uncharacterized protein B0I36DRAFT_132552 [Microdochium trichocladiopsis]|uniref:Uncharacterized protein n=1 Tax=Microdochium trichocladiopsis TaxID=1682393 RepID=A0A9P8Y2U7_9PEZI|nr:uncharacterized protein B0I36DRAFT_132552 [Microdochium trichocladiopsis]KAH7029429.1 hypothetical protein B0I36DRAFT_132552 [Microdochium trichocladiopsis]
MAAPDSGYRGQWTLHTVRVGRVVWKRVSSDLWGRGKAAQDVRRGGPVGTRSTTPFIFFLFRSSTSQVKHMRGHFPTAAKTCALPPTYPQPNASWHVVPPLVQKQSP